jgi:hypothetical protein
MPNQQRTQKPKAKQPVPEPNPALKEIGILAGEWKMELFNSTFLPNPSDIVKGTVYFEWVEDGAFLEMRQGDKRPAPPAAIWLIGRDESSGKYEVLYFDARGVSRIYQMSFDGSLWKMWRESPGFSQRFEGKLSQGGSTIDARWEKTTDGVTWEHDFDMKYTRRK